MKVSGNETMLYIDDLTPFTNYSYRVEACTVAGCTSSNLSNTVTTLQASTSLKQLFVTCTFCLPIQSFCLVL